MGSIDPPRSNSKSRPRSPARWVSAVEVTDNSSPSSAIEAKVFSAPGMMAHQVGVESTTGLEFHWKGRSHYVALHDLHHIDAETFADGKPVDRRRDLRGLLTFAPAGCHVWGWSIPSTSHQSFTALYLDPHHMETELAKRLTHLPESSELYFTNAALRSTLEKLGRALSSNIRPDAMYLESLCVMSMLELCIFRQGNIGSEGRPAGGLAKSLERQLTEYVAMNLSRDIGLNDLAQIAGLSRYHFLRAFQRTTGQTPYRYLLEQRIAMAQSLLKGKSMSVTDIAVAVGFKDATRLSRAFRKLTGITPGAYRAS